ncbi:putative P-loop containing nucleoside triphosphate hydrolase protein [Seiridium cardinale]
MDDDSSSNASFEEIGPRGNRHDDDDLRPIDERTFDRLKALVAKSTADGTKQVIAGDMPDVLYTLLYKERYSGRTTELCRSVEPIDIHNLDEDSLENATAGDKKPILEIVTKVSTTIVNKVHNGPPPPPPPVYDDDYDYDYDYGFNHRPYRGKQDDEMKITNVEETVMVINSPYLINALKAVVDYYPEVSFIGDNVKINAPYHVLVHHRHALASFKVRQPEAHNEEYAFMTARHIDVLLGFLNRTLGEDLKEEEKRNSHKAGPKTVFKNLWMLFKPGDVVYSKLDGRWNPFVVCRCFDGSAKTVEDDRGYSYKLDAWNLIISGKKLRRVMYTFAIRPFMGEDAIDNMPVIPARFFKVSAEAARNNVELGKRAWELAKGPTYMSYDGSLAKRGADHDWNYAPSASGQLNDRVIVDCEGFNRFSADCPGGSHRRAVGRPPRNQTPPPKDQLPYFKQRCGCTACGKAHDEGEVHPFAKFEDLKPTEDPAPENDLYYMVLSKTVSGFILSERRWAHFYMEFLSEVKHDKEAFKYLVLDEEIKLTVRALIGKFSSANGQVTPWPSDFVKNKGKGRIFLLHGSPGVGKTATCESIAELARRPLLALTSGDLSTNSLWVEKNLEYFLQLGERFGAMVLLDEADVYLESRRAKDIARNGLVSIFLRALEYYRGVLFLTTNRVQTFDAAFTSRIHVALHYKPLTDADREKVWLNSFERLERDSGGKVHISVASREYAYDSDDVQSLRWNGREIRNALQTAVALAETEALDNGLEKVTVTDKHLRAVAKMSRGFKNFLHQRRLGDEDELDDDDEDDEVEEEEVYSPGPPDLYG